MITAAQIADVLVSGLTVQQLVQAMSTLPVEKQLDLHRSLTDMIKRGRKAKAVAAGAAFNIGDIVRFDAKTQGMKIIKVEKFNRAGTAVVGYETDIVGTRRPNAIRLTVDTGLCILAT